MVLLAQGYTPHSVSTKSLFGIYRLNSSVFYVNIVANKESNAAYMLRLVLIESYDMMSVL